MDNILIIGASSDIGRALILNLDRRGQYRFLAHYHQSFDKLNELSSHLKSPLIPLKADLNVNSDIINIVNSCKEMIPSKIIFLAAPRVSNIRFRKIEWNDFKYQLEVQLKSSVIILREFLPKMAKKKSGKVVFMLSSYTKNVPPIALAHYVSTKYAMLGLMKALAVEYRGQKININAISPSMIETSFLENLPEKLVELNSINHPYGRNAQPEDIIPTIEYLLSNASDYVTGANIIISGGEVF